MQTRARLTLMLATLAALAALTPATADARSVTQVPQGAQTSIEGDVMTGAFACVATATPDAASVNITMCEARTSSGAVHQAALTIVQPGPASATASGFLRIPVQLFRVCMRTEVIWLDGSRVHYPEVCR